MVVIRGRLLAEEGALLRKALEAMTLPKEQTGPGKRFADAIVQMAELALGSSRGAEASNADRFQVVLHVDERVLAGAAGEDAAAGEQRSMAAAFPRRCAGAWPVIVVWSR
jgi:hypothetical protein